MSMAAAKSGPDLSHYPGGEALYRLRHSAAHVLASAVTELFPDVKVAGGPPIETGFYYDFARAQPFTPEDLEKIEARMREIVASEVSPLPEGGRLGSDSGFPARIRRSASVSPSRNCITRKDTLPSRLTSYRMQMFGWSRAEIARASRSNRSRISGLSAIDD